MSEQVKPMRVEVTIDADRGAVWPALTVPERIREWFGWDHDGIDAEIRYIFVDHAKLDPPEGMHFEDGSRIELTTAGTGTLAALVRPGTPGQEPDHTYDAIEEGWRAFLEQLRFLLETGPEGRRRTVYLTGPAKPGRAVALTGVQRQWHDSRYLRMTVDPGGHLVALAGEAPLADDATAPLSVTVTTYGLDDATFAAVQDEWSRRWAELVDEPAEKLSEPSDRKET